MLTWRGVVGQDYGAGVDASMATALLTEGLEGSAAVDASPIHSAVDRFSAASHSVSLAALVSGGKQMRLYRGLENMWS